MAAADCRVSLRSFVEACPQPFIVIDQDDTVLAVNEAYRRAYGSAMGDPLGRRCYQLEHHRRHGCERSAEACPHRRVRETGSTYSALHVHERADGKRYRVRVTVRPIEGDDGRMLLGETLEEALCLNEPETADGPPPMVGESRAFCEVLDQLLHAAASGFPVLLLGETGTGKELAAGFVHRHSARCDRPFLTLDCTTLTESLFESEVFGHERGAFTGSVGAKPGLFELADGGTLFLDEVGELPTTSQAKLLRALESGEFRRVGGSRTRRADVRVVCATNRHLRELVERMQFREDLFYRIACLTVHLPALRERRSDIPELARTFLRDLPQPRAGAYRIGDAALHLLMAHELPGNIRQLRNLVYAAASASRGGDIDGECMAKVLRHTAGGPTCPAADTAPATASGPERPSLSEMECRYIAELLEQFGGNRRKVATQLGVSTRTLYRKLNRYGFN